MQQKRFVYALLISAAILFGSSYLQRRFYPPAPQPENNNANSAQQQPVSSPSTPQQAKAPTAAEPHGTTGTTAAGHDSNARRTVTVSTPLYQARFDSLGGVATSWIVKKDKATNRDLYASDGSKNNPKPLELIPQDAVSDAKAELNAPLKLMIENQSDDTNSVLATRNYAFGGSELSDGKEQLNLAPGEVKRLDFTLHDEGSGLDVVKSITFIADEYSAELQVTIKRKEQPVPQAYLMIGPSIGDQGVAQFTFYSVAPEGIAETSAGVQRFQSVAIHKNEGGWFSSKRPEGADRQIVPGAVEWAGVGDTYFAMVAAPSKAGSGLEYHTTAYQKEINGAKEERYLITGLIPIPADGSNTALYVGPKDHDLLVAASQDVRRTTGRQVDLEGLLNYGFFSSIRRPLAVPILWSINRLQRITGSYGIAIILFTIFIYSLFFPLKWRSSRAMKKAQKLAPRMKELQEKIKGMKQTDPRLKELQVEQLRLMKEGNPLGGCLPLLIQMPFLFALYSAITISIDFRQASFLWIPDLSSAEPYFLHVVRILPLLFATSMIVLQLMTPAPSADPLQRKMMAVGMPMFMLYVLWSAPAGLLVYWLVGNIVGFSQQFLINHLTKSEDDGEPPGATEAMKSNKPKKLSPAGAS